MSPDVQTERAEAAEKAARALLRPVLKLLFGRALTRQALEAYCDEAYVEAAAQKVRQTEQDVGLKDVAELSGVSLAKVRRLKEVVREQSKIPAVPISEQAPLVAAATRVITGWYSDAACSDEDGHPLSALKSRQRRKTASNVFSTARSAVLRASRRCARGSIPWAIRARASSRRSRALLRPTSG